MAQANPFLLQQLMAQAQQQAAAIADVGDPQNLPQDLPQEAPARMQSEEPMSSHSRPRRRKSHSTPAKFNPDYRSKFNPEYRSGRGDRQT